MPRLNPLYSLYAPLIRKVTFSLPQFGRPKKTPQNPLSNIRGKGPHIKAKTFPFFSSLPVAGQYNQPLSWGKGIINPPKRGLQIWSETSFGKFNPFPCRITTLTETDRPFVDFLAAINPKSVPVYLDYSTDDICFFPIKIFVPGRWKKPSVIATDYSDIWPALLIKSISSSTKSIISR
ncbi:MAG: hypothetical protein CM15mP85_17930 [Rhodobacterales bacterium]|nr:MAG: hypothetical protein CM15mP85_17930 [Rhodobacterales bacterium]